MKTKHLKNYIAILAIVNYRNWYILCRLYHLDLKNVSSAFSAGNRQHDKLQTARTWYLRPLSLDVMLEITVLLSILCQYYTSFRCILFFFFSVNLFWSSNNKHCTVYLILSIAKTDISTPFWMTFSTFLQSFGRKKNCQGLKGLNTVA